MEKLTNVPSSNSWASNSDHPALESWDLTVIPPVSRIRLTAIILKLTLSAWLPVDCVMYQLRSSAQHPEADTLKGMYGTLRKAWQLGAHRVRSLALPGLAQNRENSVPWHWPLESVPCRVPSMGPVPSTRSGSIITLVNEFQVAWTHLRTRCTSLWQRQWGKLGSWAQSLPPGRVKFQKLSYHSQPKRSKGRNIAPKDNSSL